MRVTQETSDFAHQIVIGDKIKIDPTHRNYFRVVDIDYSRDENGARMVTFYAPRRDGTPYARRTAYIDDEIVRVVRMTPEQIADARASMYVPW